MRRVSLAALALLLLLGFMAPRAFALPRDAALDKGLTNDDAYAYALQMNSLTAGSDEALGMLEEALNNAPDSPGFYFTLSVAKFPSVVKSFDLFVEGMKAYNRSFWWRLSLIALILEAALISAAIALTAAALLRFPRDLPLISHDINEHKAQILLPLLIMPLALLGPLPFVAGVLFLVGMHMKRSNKLVAYLALLFIALAPLWTDFVGKTASLTNPVVRAVVDVNEGRDNTLALSTLAGREDFPSMFSYAIALKREGRAEEAVELLQGLIETHTDHRLYNNLGNAYVAIDRRDLAKTVYLKAIEQGRSVTTLYNLAQIYRDELDYENGEKYFNQAQQMNKAQVSDYTARTAKHYNRMVFDETLTFREITTAAWGSDVRNSVRGFPMGTVIPAGVAGGLLVLFMILGKLMPSSAFRCKNCGKVACHACAESEKMCMACQGKLSEAEDASPQSRVKRMLHANQQKTRQMTIIRVLSFLPPGIAQTYSGRLLSGFLYMWFFGFGVAVLVLDPFMSTGLAGNSHGWLWLLMAPMLLLVYYVSILTVSRRLDRGWL